jgi:antitoxin component of RelBE/YafQ-DinJ toxin-antitoxin module
MRFDDDTRERLDAAAKRIGVSSAAVLRMLVRRYAATLRCEASARK